MVLESGRVRESVALPSPQPAAMRCLQQLFEDHAARTPEAVALVCGRHVLTYRELNARANRLAHYLMSRGVKAETLVGICMHRRIEMIVGLLAVLKAGGAYVPLDAAYPQQRLVQMVSDVEMRAILTSDDVLDRLEGASSELIALDLEFEKWAELSTEDPVDTTSANALCYVIFTSGSTGKPKAAGVEHRGWSNLVTWFRAEFEIVPSDRNLVMSSFSFDITQRSIMMALSTGAQLHLFASPVYDAGLIVENIASAEITLLNCAPSTFYPLVERSRKPKALRSLRKVFLGGEPISASRLQTWARSEECNSEIVNVYGVAECSDVSTFHRLKDFERYAVGSVPLGIPIYNSQVYVVDEELRSLPAGSIGEICLAGIGVGRGYVNDRELTRQKFVADPFSDAPGRMYRTGDLGRLTAQGSLEFHGRVDNQVKVAGTRIELGEVEVAIRQSPQVSEVVVVTREFSEDDHRLVACVVPSGSEIRQDELASHLREFLAQRVPPHMIPSNFHMLQSLPLSPNGKVDRGVLRGLVAEARIEVASGVGAPRTRAEDEVARVFCKVLKLDRVGVEDGFFELGGTSYLVTEALSEFADLGFSHISVVDFLMQPTPEELAKLVVAEPEFEHLKEKLA